MIRSRRAKRVATLVAPGCAAAFLAGVAQGPAHYLVLPDSYPWLLAYWSTALALIAIVVALALRMAVDRQELASTSAGLGSLLFATLLTAFAVGLAWPCLVGLDNEGQEPTCADLVTFYPGRRCGVWHHLRRFRRHTLLGGARTPAATRLAPPERWRTAGGLA